MESIIIYKMKNKILLNTPFDEKIQTNQLEIIEADESIENHINDIHKINEEIVHLMNYKKSLAKNNCLLRILSIKYIKNELFLREKFFKWLNYINKMNKIDKILFGILNKENEKNNNMILQYLLKWKYNTKNIIKETPKKKIAVFFKEKYKISKARYYWTELSNLYILFSRLKIIKVLAKKSSIQRCLYKIYKIYQNKLYLLLSKALKKWYLTSLKIKENESNKQLKELNKKIEEFNKLKDKDYIIKMLISKDEEINELKDSLSRYPFQLSKGEYILSLIIISSDQGINFPIICKNKDSIFNIVVNKLYEKFPKYKKMGNNFICNGKLINEYLTMEENGIKNGNIILINNF